MNEEPLNSTWSFYVRQFNSDNEFFELVVTELDQDTVRVTSMNHFGLDAYKSKGIPDALLSIAKTKLGRRFVVVNPSRTLY